MKLDKITINYIEYITNQLQIESYTSFSSLNYNILLPFKHLFINQYSDYIIQSNTVTLLMDIAQKTNNNTVNEVLYSFDKWVAKYIDENESSLDSGLIELCKRRCLYICGYLLFTDNIEINILEHMIYSLYKYSKVNRIELFSIIDLQSVLNVYI